MVNPSMCRVCESTKNLTDIFVKNDQKILNQMRLFLNHSIDVNDRLPQCICIDCVAQLNDAYNFKIQYELLNQKYQKAVLSVSDEDEKVFSCQTAETSSSLPNYGFIKNELDKDAVEVIVLNESDAEQDDIASGSKTAKTESVYVSEIVVKEELSPTYLDDDTDDEEDDDEKDNKVSQIDSAKMGECSGLNGANSTNNEGKPRQRNIIFRKVRTKPVLEFLDGFKCKKCRKIFPTQAQRMKHEKRDLCTTTTFVSKNLPNSNNFAICKECGNVYSGLSAYQTLRMHMNLHSKVFQCEKCQTPFRSHTDLKDHLLWHRNENAFKCIVCGVRFKTSSALRCHLSRHENSTDFALNRRNTSEGKVKRSSKN